MFYARMAWVLQFLVVTFGLKGIFSRKSWSGFMLLLGFSWLDFDSAFWIFLCKVLVFFTGLECFVVKGNLEVPLSLGGPLSRPVFPRRLLRPTKLPLEYRRSCWIACFQFVGRVLVCVTCIVTYHLSKMSCQLLWLRPMARCLSVGLVFHWSSLQNCLEKGLVWTSAHHSLLICRTRQTCVGRCSLSWALPVLFMPCDGV